MEELLDAASQAREVIIYGHSGTLLPSLYFQRGVTRLCWSIIPRTFLDLFEARLKEKEEEKGSFADFIDSVLADSITIHAPQVCVVNPPTTIRVPCRICPDKSHLYEIYSQRSPSQLDRNTYTSLHIVPSDQVTSTDVTISEIETLLRLAERYFLKGRPDWAEYYYTKALEIASCLGDLRTVAECTYRLGLIYLNAGDQVRGHEWLECSLYLWTALSEIDRQIDILAKLGRSFSEPVLAPRIVGKQDSGNIPEKTSTILFTSPKPVPETAMDQVFETDWLASEPVFYNELTRKVSHNIHDVIDYSSLEFDPEGLNNYLDFGFSVFEQTPIKHVKFLRHSSRLIVKPDGTMQIIYLDDPVEKWLGKVSLEDDVLERLSVLIGQLETSTREEIVVSASGGYDCRLLLSHIRDRSRVRAFSYGVSPNQEISRDVVYARRLADILGFQWEQIVLDGFHHYFDVWEKLYGPSTHTHAHGMHYIEFVLKVRSRVKENTLFLNGVFGDCWAGRIQFPTISDCKAITLLGHTHGMNADSKESLLKTDYSLREKYWEKTSEFLADDVFRSVEVARTRAMLLSYFGCVPKYYGFKPYLPFVDFELAMKMLTLPPKRRRDRLWQKEFFKMRGLDLENMGLVADTKFGLDIQAIKTNPPRLLDVRLLREIINPSYIEWINQNLVNIHRRIISSKALKAYYAYLVLLPLENLIRRREAQYYGQENEPTPNV